MPLLDEDDDGWLRIPTTKPVGEPEESIQPTAIISKNLSGEIITTVTRPKPVTNKIDTKKSFFDDDIKIRMNLPPDYPPIPYNPDKYQ